MPAHKNSRLSDTDRKPGARLPCAPSTESLDPSDRTLAIGLINNMSDGVLEATERQFLSLLGSASDATPIHLSFYTLPGIPRTEAGARHISQYYASTESLWGAKLDGLIVTGREPLTADLADEPYWESFTNILDWARENTLSTVWSCLAAHAAVQYMDDIRRIRSQRKYCGIFECAQVAEHAINRGLSSGFRVPHSRWNGLPEDELVECGYRILTRTADTSVDAFVKQEGSLFVFLQGHPEYEATTLLHEYRRDVGRYLRRESDTYPSMPQRYFDHDAVTVAEAIREEAIAYRNEDLAARISGAFENITIENTWRPTAVGIYRNWLRYISEQKDLAARCGKKSTLAPQIKLPLAESSEAGEGSSEAILATSLQDPSTTLTASRNTSTIL